MMQISQVPFTPDLKRKIQEGFRKHAIQEMGYEGIEDPIAFIAQEENQLVGAIVVRPYWGALHFKNLWVSEKKKGRGIGKQLMKKALDFGEKQGYLFAFVETFSFQASEFYQKFGFQIEFTRKGFSHGVSILYLRKDFLSH